LGVQILHPAIAAALEQHVRMRLWFHERRTASRAIAAAYDDRPRRHAMAVIHEHVKGVDDMGQRFHAVHPEVFHFQHATYVETLVVAINTFIAPMSDRDHERLYEQCCEWYLRYGVSARPVPPTWADFVDYFEHTCDTRLRPTPASRKFMPVVLRPDAWVPRLVPSAVARELQHPRARELFGVVARSGDRAAFRTYAAGLRLATPLTPSRVRYMPSARASSKLHPDRLALEPVVGLR
jgi:uncharacterized protein (DUF2236 family)